MGATRIAAAFLVGAATLATAQEPARPRLPSIPFRDLTGQPFELNQFLGAVTVLNFWATWCGPCRIEMPELQKLYNEFGGKGLVVLAVDVDLAATPEDLGNSQLLDVLRPRVQGFLARTGITLPVYLVDGATQASLGVDRIPFSILLDREGGVVRVYPGYSPDSMADLRKRVLGALAERSKGGK